MDKVQVFGFWASPFSMRVEVALKMKGVEYEYIEEDIQNMSEELLKYNPIHKKVPVLVHNGKAIAESLVIMEYIDDVWKDNQILPSEPYERAQARFWAKFIDDKLLVHIRPATMSEGEESEKAIKELHELLKFLENEIGGKKSVGGNNIAYLDIVASVVPIWLPCRQEVIGEEVLRREKYPLLYTWADEFLECNVIKRCMPDKGKLLAYYKARLAAINDKNTN